MTVTTSSKATSPFAKIVTWVLVLAPILQTYGWGKYDFTFILATLLSLLALVSGMIDFRKLPKYLLLYFIYWLLIHEISATTLEEAIPLGVVKTILVFGLFFSVIKLSHLIKYYRIVVQICILFFLVQLIIKVTTGVNVLGVFNFLPLALNTDSSSYFQDRMESLRLSSFFSEPAHFAQYTMPYLVLLLFDEKKKIIEIVIVVASLLFMQSGNALVSLVVCFTIYLVYRMKGGVKQKIGVVFLSVVLVAGGIAFTTTEMGQRLMLRVDQVNANSVYELGYSTSGFERIYRGYYVYGEYSTSAKIFGNDNPLYKENAAKRSVMSFFFNDDYQYYNTIQGYLLNTGIIGILIIIFVYKNILRITDIRGKCILILSIALSFMSSCYFTEIMCMYLLFPSLMRAQEQQQKYINLKFNEKKSIHLYKLQ